MSSQYDFYSCCYSWVLSFGSFLLPQLIAWQHLPEPLKCQQCKLSCSNGMAIIANDVQQLGRGERNGMYKEMLLIQGAARHIISEIPELLMKEITAYSNNQRIPSLITISFIVHYLRNCNVPKPVGKKQIISINITLWAALQQFFSLSINATKSNNTKTKK